MLQCGNGQIIEGLSYKYVFPHLYMLFLPPIMLRLMHKNTKTNHNRFYLHINYIAQILIAAQILIFIYVRSLGHMRCHLCSCAYSSNAAAQIELVFITFIFIYVSLGHMLCHFCSFLSMFIHMTL